MHYLDERREPTLLLHPSQALLGHPLTLVGGVTRVGLAKAIGGLSCTLENKIRNCREREEKSRHSREVRGKIRSQKGN